MTFQYENTFKPTPAILPNENPRWGTQERDEGGVVQGVKASDLEVRMDRAWEKLQIQYTFRARISPAALGVPKLTKVFTNLPGEIEIDNLVNYGTGIPIMIDGEISHYMTDTQKLDDKQKTSSINDFGKLLGWQPVVRVPFVDIPDQASADRVARQILEGSYIARDV